MAVTADVLINTKYAANSAANEYQSAVGTKTIIDKFTATNTTGGAVTLTVALVPSGGSEGASNRILSAFSIPANTCLDLTQIQNQILAAGDFISCTAGSSSAIVIRCSGRKVT